MNIKRLNAVIACVAIFLLSACGGSGGGSSTASGAVDFSAVISKYGIGRSGVGGDSKGNAGAAGGAGDGAPLANAIVTLTDAIGNIVTGNTDSSGKYLLLYQTSIFKAPMVLRVVDAGGNVLASVAETIAANGTADITNVNPLTDKIVSDILSSAVAGTDKSFNGSALNVAQISTAKANLATSLNAAYVAAGISDPSGFDPIKSSYVYDGTGIDAVIESISHSRNPSTGATELSIKMASVTNNADGTVVPNLITSANPLPVAYLALPASPVLTFSKLSAWVGEMNRCLALDSATRSADANCLDASGTRLVATGFLHDSKDLAENYRSLFSNADLSAIQGSTLRNPVILFTAKYDNSLATYDDIAVVEMTVLQPSTGPLDSSLSTPIEYTATFVFKRNDALSAVAGNWILNGNQRQYDLNLTTRYIKNTQLNPARAANIAGNQPSSWESRINAYIGINIFNKPTRTYTSANIRAVRVTGPGLPANGIVLAPTSNSSAFWMGIYNLTGIVPITNVTTSQTANSYGLAAIASDGSAYQPNYGNSINASTMLSDFASLKAFSRYMFEIYLTSNAGNTTPDSILYSRNVAPVFSPSVALNFPVNDISPSASLMTPPQLATATITPVWINNPNAAPVDSVSVFAQQQTPTVSQYDVFKKVVGAYSLQSRPTSQLVTAPSGVLPSFTSGVAGDSRFIAIWANQGRANVESTLNWANY